MSKVSKGISVLLVIFLFLTSACKASISRNEDGTITLETTITQQELQQVITTSIADPLIQELTVTLQSGYVLVTGARQRLNEPGKSDTLSFRLDLGVSNNQISSRISAAQIDGVAIEQNRVDLWNQTIANRLTLLGKKSGNSTLQSVSITPEIVTMSWHAVRQ